MPNRTQELSDFFLKVERGQRTPITGIDIVSSDEIKNVSSGFRIDPKILYQCLIQEINEAMEDKSNLARVNGLLGLNFQEYAMSSPTRALKCLTTELKGVLPERAYKATEKVLVRYAFYEEHDFYVPLKEGDSNTRET